MKIAFEGPQAAGKTTTALRLQTEGGALVVSEVNALFKRPAVQPDGWYLERKICRWEIGQKNEETGKLAFLSVSR